MQRESVKFPGIVIAALRGGSGKTFLSIGIIAAWTKQKKAIAPFKKGPDYIDTGWLALAAGRPCYNLDTFLINNERVLHSFQSHALQGDIAVIEGNRGLYDGVDIEGSTSTAELAKLLNSPVILCIDCTKATRTMAAVVLGCIRFDPYVNIKGVVLNRIAGTRHENILRTSIEYHCGIPVLGAIPKLGKQHFPERHLGLVPAPEHGWAQDAIDAASQMAESCLDLDTLAEVAYDAPIQKVAGRSTRVSNRIVSPRPRIGILKDAAFQFYYPENLENLVSAGADLVFISPLKNTSLPDIDALYMGGGFPETHAKELAANKRFKEEIKVLAEEGLPIYAECGGLMYLGEELVLDKKSYKMAGVLPIVFGFFKKPQGHGYTVIHVEGKNPYFKVGSELKGHEFHYSRVLEWRGDAKDLVFTLKKGTGFTNNKDGICYKNVLATYTHLHALGVPSWAEAMVSNAISFRNSNKQGSGN